VRTTARRLTRPVARFLALESSSGLLLLGATVVALVWANSPWRDGYTSLMTHPLPIEVPGITVHLDVQEWVNDALMAVFFLVVGLEIRRELVAGELRDRRAATLPVIAAIGGMVVPALLYVAITAGSGATRGWGIPMATDIAFAVGVIDDLGAIVVIAVFYGHTSRP